MFELSLAFQHKLRPFHLYKTSLEPLAACKSAMCIACGRRELTFGVACRSYAVILALHYIPGLLA